MRAKGEKHWGILKTWKGKNTCVGGIQSQVSKSKNKDERKWGEKNSDKPRFRTGLKEGKRD